MLQLRSSKSWRVSDTRVSEWVKRKAPKLDPRFANGLGNPGRDPLAAPHRRHLIIRVILASYYSPPHPRSFGRQCQQGFSAPARHPADVCTQFAAARPRTRSHNVRMLILFFTSEHRPRPDEKAKAVLLP